MTQSTKDATNAHGLLAIFKGESGEGKSVAALSFPNAYVFDFDRKMPSIAQKHFPDKEFFWDTFDSIWDIDNKLSEFFEYCPYETLIIDSFTALVNIILSTYSQLKGETIQDSLSKLGKSGQLEAIPIDFYNGEDRFCTYFIDRLKTLWARASNPKHVIVIAHIVVTESSPDLKTKIVTRSRSIVSKGRKTAAWLPTGFDNVYVFGRQLPDFGDLDQSVKRIIRTEAFGEDTAKCSYNFPETINFTNGSFYDILVSHGLDQRKMLTANQSLLAETESSDI